MLQILTIRSLHLILFNLHRTQAERSVAGVRAQLDDPQHGFLPSLSFLTFRFPLQTIYRRILHSFHPRPRLPGLHVRHTTPTHTFRKRCNERKMCDLEGIEIWERFARIDQL